MAPGPKMRGDGAIRGEATLSVPGRLEPLHASLPLARRLMRVLRAVIEVPVLSMLDTREEFPLRRALARQLVRDEDPGHVR